MNSPDFSQSRRAMIDSQLRTGGVNAPWIIAAMGAAKREEFVAPDRASTAYMDRSIALGDGRSLNPPLTTAMMLDVADVRGDDNILIIGAATGYLAGLVSTRAAKIVAVEQSDGLMDQAKQNLKGRKNIHLVSGALADGAKKHGPYSLIMIDGAIAQLPPQIVAQLAEGGRLVTGLTDGAVNRLAMGTQHRGDVVLRAIADVEVAPLPGFEHAKEFVF